MRLFLCVCALITAFILGQERAELLYRRQLMAQNAELRKIESEARTKEKKYGQHVTDLQMQVIDLQNKYNNTVDSLRMRSSDRLLESNARAELYKSQARDCTAKSADLAAHAAELDRQLTEGIGVVRELSELVRLRDEQLRQLGKQLQMDRDLFNE